MPNALHDEAARKPSTFFSSFAARALLTGGLVVLSVVAPALASTQVIYAGNFTQAAALTHLNGAHTTDPLVVERAIGRTSTTITVHIHVNKINADWTGAQWRRYQSATLDISSGSASMFLRAETPAVGANAAVSQCLTSGRMAQYPGGPAVSLTTNTYVFRISMSDLAKCGFVRGKTVNILGASGIGVDNYPSAGNTGGFRSGWWGSNQFGIGMWFTFRL